MATSCHSCSLCTVIKDLKHLYNLLLTFSRVTTWNCCISQKKKKKKSISRALTRWRVATLFTCTFLVFKINQEFTNFHIPLDPCCSHLVPLTVILNIHCPNLFPLCSLMYHPLKLQGEYDEASQ